MNKKLVLVSLPSAMVTALGKLDKGAPAHFLALPSAMTMALGKELFFLKKTLPSATHPALDKDFFKNKKIKNFAESHPSGARQRN